MGEGVVTAPPETRPEAAPGSPAGRPFLAVDGLTKRFDGGAEGVLAVDGVSFEVPAGTFFTLLGPSGCGKTTTLRALAGLETPDRGRITLGGRVLFSSADKVDVPTNRRGLGMVFQSYAIWPHMTVYDNAAFPLAVLPRRGRPPRAELRARVERILEVVQLGGLEGRPATDLSGGQQQRLALARALVLRPSLVLLDEPLSNLDAKLRDSMRLELKRLQRDLDVTMVYVTHDQGEALAMSDQVAVMHAGSVAQLGTPEEIYQAPRTEFVADFIGQSNFLPGTVTEHAGGDDHVVGTAAGPVVATRPETVDQGEPVLVMIRTENVRLTPGRPAEERPGRLHGTVVNRIFLGADVEYRVDVRGTELVARTRLADQVGSDGDVTVDLPARHCRLLPTGR
jgi:iron(III) transport system ATP-binding protein